MKKIHQKSSLHQLTMNKMQFGDVSRALKSVVLGKLDNTNLTSYALAVVKSLCNGTSGCIPAEVTQNGRKKKKLSNLAISSEVLVVLLDTAMKTKAT